MVESGTKLAGRVARGEVPAPEDDDEADKYEAADAALSAAGFGWYEISNWARTPRDVSRHNLGYWSGGDWWGIGPGAHSHVGGVRWWNVKHPTAYAARLAAGHEPGPGARGPDGRAATSRAGPAGRPVGRRGCRSTRSRIGTRVAPLIADGLVDGAEAIRGRVRLTLRGRLLADTVVSALLP